MTTSQSIELKFEKHVIPEPFHGHEYDDICWVCGIYKIVPYNRMPGRPKNSTYAAYYKPDGWKNWGKHVNPGTPYYETLEQAQAACVHHANHKEA